MKFPTKALNLALPLRPQVNEFDLDFGLFITVYDKDGHRKHRVEVDGEDRVLDAIKHLEILRKRLHSAGCSATVEGIYKSESECSPPA